MSNLFDLYKSGNVAGTGSAIRPRRMTRRPNILSRSVVRKVSASSVTSNTVPESRAATATATATATASVTNLVPEPPEDNSSPDTAKKPESENDSSKEESECESDFGLAGLGEILEKYQPIGVIDNTPLFNDPITKMFEDDDDEEPGIVDYSVYTTEERIIQDALFNRPIVMRFGPDEDISDRIHSIGFDGAKRALAAFRAIPKAPGQSDALNEAAAAAATNVIRLGDVVTHTRKGTSRRSNWRNGGRSHIMEQKMKKQQSHNDSEKCPSSRNLNTENSTTSTTAASTTSAAASAAAAVAAASTSNGEKKVVAEPRYGTQLAKKRMGLEEIVQMLESEYYYKEEALKCQSEVRESIQEPEEALECQSGVQEAEEEALECQSELQGAEGALKRSSEDRKPLQEAIEFWRHVEAVSREVREEEISKFESEVRKSFEEAIEFRKHLEAINREANKEALKRQLKVRKPVQEAEGALKCQSEIRKPVQETIKFWEYVEAIRRKLEEKAFSKRQSKIREPVQEAEEAPKRQSEVHEAEGALRRQSEVREPIQEAKRALKRQSKVRKRGKQRKRSVQQASRLRHDFKRNRNGNDGDDDDDDDIIFEYEIVNDEEKAVIDQLVELCPEYMSAIDYNDYRWYQKLKDAACNKMQKLENDIALEKLKHQKLQSKNQELQKCRRQRIRQCVIRESKRKRVSVDDNVSDDDDGGNGGDDYSYDNDNDNDDSDSDVNENADIITNDDDDDDVELIYFEDETMGLVAQKRGDYLYFNGATDDTEILNM